MAPLCHTKLRRVTCLSSVITGITVCLFRLDSNCTNKTQTSLPCTCRTSRTAASGHVLFLADGQFHRNLTLIEAPGRQLVPIHKISPACLFFSSACATEWFGLEGTSGDAPAQALPWQQLLPARQMVEPQLKASSSASPG